MNDKLLRARETSDSNSDDLVTPSINSGGNLVDDSQMEISLDLKYETSSVCQQTSDSELNETLSSDTSDEVDSDEEREPLGYQSFLCDVNIEYNLGGKRSDHGSHEYSFKLKRLPYMVEGCRRSSISSSRNSYNSNPINGDGSSSNNTSNCDQNKLNSDFDIECNTDDSNLSEIHFDSEINPEHLLDVSKTSCAFLGNSDYAPNLKTRRKRVVLELVSAKLADNNYSSASGNPSNITNLITLAENTTANVRNEAGTTDPNQSGGNGQEIVKISKEREQITLAASSSKKFVSYTILVRMVPGLDHYPAVIERRFSDFLALYQGLKRNKDSAKIVDDYVRFPKKVYMGNFTIEKIAERSIEFARLLNLCMKQSNLTWSVPFVSFLVDKELKEAHRLSMFGDPDDVQALIETVYHIFKKLYLKTRLNTDTSSISSQHQARSPSSLSTDITGTSSSQATSSSHSQQVSCKEGSPAGSSSEQLQINASPKISQRKINTSRASHQSQTFENSDINTNNHEGRTNNGAPLVDPVERNHHPSSNGEPVITLIASSIGPINQRLLVTYCMLLVVHCRSYDYSGLRKVVQEFSQLISSQDFIDSLIFTRHYYSLRASLLFLMNLNQGNVIDESRRLWLKRRLEDIDANYAELTNSKNDDDNRGKFMTKKDLTSLLRDRSFCTFQDNIK